MALTHGSLFTGYGGLDMAIEEWFGAETVWVSEIEASACKVLARRKPGVPNLGDVTKIDWANVQSVDILSGGSPCQDVSQAGRVRLGMKEGTRSNLWVAMREAIKHLQPRLVVWENVRGVVNAEAHSDMESGHGHMGGPYIRALGRVLGDLTALGYDCEWRNVLASDAGAPHRRERIFLLAVRRDSDSGRIRRREGRTGPVAFPQLADHPSDMGESNLIGATGDKESRPLFGSHEGRIRAWGDVLGRHAPPPVEVAERGGQRLSPRFSEWCMGLPEGWVTDPSIDVSRKERLRMLGNGVVPQQATLAFQIIEEQHDSD